MRADALVLELLNGAIELPRFGESGPRISDFALLGEDVTAGGVNGVWTGAPRLNLFKLSHGFR
jgi:hypothetical protein